MILRILLLLLALPVLADEVVVVAPSPVVVPVPPAPMPKIIDVTLPVNPSVVSGAAAITFTPDTMTVTPSTNRTWIQYDSFDVGKNATVRFQQGPANLTVNEVTGSKMSDIAGRIHVTDGSIVLMNRNGQIFRDGAILDGNIMVSTVPLNQQEFMNSGKLLFESAGLLGQKPLVRVGSVKASGLSVFIAPWFESLGLFTGNLHVFSGESVSLSLCGNTLARFEVQGALKDSLLHVAEGSEIEGQQVVLHTGHMEEVMDSSIKVDGSLKAQDIMVVGNEITLSETSSLDVGGDTGGTIRLGVDQDYDLKDLKRFDHVLAQNITIKEGAKLLAPGEDQGGTIYTFANKTGNYKGTYDVSSTEGPGGFLELSAHDNLRLSPIIDWKGASAPGKMRGRMLLDPATVFVTGAVGSINNGGDQGPGNHNPLLDGTVNAALLAGDVTITATTSITTAADSTIDWVNSNTLTLSAPTIALGGLIDMTDFFSSATLNLVASTGLTMAGGRIFIAANTLNITSPAFITGGTVGLNTGTIHQTEVAPGKIRVTGKGFSTTTPVVKIDFGAGGRNITSADYTLVTSTPANVPNNAGSPTAGSPVSGVTTSSGNVTVDPRLAQIERLYLALFGRGADWVDLNYWLGKMIGGESLKDVAESFLTMAPEAIRIFNGKTTDQGVEIIANNMGFTDATRLTFWKFRFNSTGANSVASASVAQELIDFIADVSALSNATGVAWAAKVQAAINATTAAAQATATGAAQATGDSALINQKLTDAYKLSGDPGAAALAFHNIGVLAKNGGYNDIAKNAFRAAAEFCLKAGNPRLAGDEYMEAGETEKALAAYKTANKNEGDAYKNAGDAYAQGRDSAAAAVAYRKAGDAYKTAGDFENAGDAYTWAGDPVNAADAYNKAGAAYEAAGETGKAVAAYKEAGDAYMLAKNPGKAADAYKQAKDFEKAGDAYTLAKDPVNAADAYKNAGDFEKAGDAYILAKDLEKAAVVYQQVVDAFLAAGNYEAGAAASEKHGDAYATSGDFQAAALAYGDMAEFYRLVNNRGKVAVAYNKKADAYNKEADAYNKEGSPVNAALVFKKAAFVYEASASNNSGNLVAAAVAHRDAGDAYKNAADAYETAGQTRDAAQAYNKAGKSYAAGNDDTAAAAAYSKEGDAYKNGGDFQSAALAYTDAGRYIAAGDAYTDAGGAYGTNDPGNAAVAYTKAGDSYAAGNSSGDAADAYNKAGNSYTSAGLNYAVTDRGKAAAAWKNAGDAYTAGTSPGDAARAYRDAGDAYVLVNHPGDAALAYNKAGDAYAGLNPAAAARAYTNAGDSYKQAGDLINAGAAYKNAGAAYKNAANPVDAAVAYKQAAGNYMSIGSAISGPAAVNAYKQAYNAYNAAGDTQGAKTASDNAIAAAIRFNSRGG